MLRRMAATAVLIGLLAPGTVAAQEAEGPTVAPAEAFGCADPGTVVLRIAFSADDTGITLVAASPRRLSSYVYDPAVSADLDVRYARECRTEGLGRTQAGNVP